ncbi:hypothetical protein SeLEV6574_g07216, partial [Synchytrium endobioticum]
MNVRGIRQKTAEIQTYITTNNIDLLVATEIKISSQTQITPFSKLPGVVTYTGDRDRRDKGGIALLLGPGNSVAQLRIATYLPPDEPISAIKEEFQALSALLPSTSVLLGDFNMGLSVGSDPRSTFLIPLLGSCNFARITTPPTFIHHNQTATTPDQIWIGAHTFKSIEATLTPPFPVNTDHQSIILQTTKGGCQLNNGAYRIKYRTRALRNDQKKRDDFEKTVKEEGRQLLNHLERTNLTFWPNCDTTRQRTTVNEAQTALTQLITHVSRKKLGANGRILKNAYPPLIAKKRQLLQRQQRQHRKHFNKHGTEDTAQRENIERTKKEIAEEIYEFHAAQPGFSKFREQLESLPNNEVTRIMA